MHLTHEALNDLRSRVLAGEDVSVEEYTTLISSLRQKRTGDVVAAAVKKSAATKPTKPQVELPDLLKDL
jgi:hypothetical protein